MASIDRTVAGMTSHLSPTPGAAILTEGLTRVFGSGDARVTAVDGLDISVGHGELVAFLGPNGAGKSTTLRMLTTLLAPSSGRAVVAGHDVARDGAAVRRAIGFVGQGNGAGHWQRGSDELMMQARLHGLTGPAARARIDELVSALDLTGLLDRKVSTLSGGQRRRLDVAIGLVNAPRVLFLDEPSTGLDPQNRANLAEQIREAHRRSGATVVLTTHYLEEADALADRVVVIDHGRVIADAPAGHLKAGIGDLLEVRVGDGDADAAAAALRRVVGDRVTADGGTLRARVPDGRAPAVDAAVAMHAAGITPNAFSLQPATLDDVFLELTGRSLRDASPTTERKAAA